MKLEDYVINKVEESLVLEFKDSRLLSNDRKDDITKAVSAMANSAGGVVIFGIEADKKTGQALAMDGGSDVETEWLDQIIQSNINPRLKVKITPLRIKNKNYFEVVIPQSYTAHQAGDHKYYRRTNRRSIPMEDYEVRDTMSRRINPVLRPNFKKVNHSTTSKEDDLVIILCNEGEVMAKYFSLEIRAPSDLFSMIQGFVGAHQKRVENQETILTYRSSSDRDMPILFPQDEYRVTDGNKYYLWIKNVAQFSNYNISWRVFADNAKPETGKVLVSEIK